MASDSDSGKEFRAEGVNLYLVEDIQVERGSSVLYSRQKHCRVSNEERKLVRKLDMRIVPIISIVYLFACKVKSSVFAYEVHDITICRFRQV